jgi:hypothetical protein
MERYTVVKGTPFFEHARCTALNAHLNGVSESSGG